MLSRFVNMEVPPLIIMRSVSVVDDITALK